MTVPILLVDIEVRGFVLRQMPFGQESLIAFPHGDKARVLAGPPAI